MGNKYRHHKMKWKVGDIIYPHYNGTAVWYKRSEWLVVTKLAKDRTFRNATCFTCIDSARVFSEFIKFKHSYLTTLEKKNGK